MAWIGCTLPVDVGGYRPVPDWAGVEQDADGDGLSVDSDCDDGNPERGTTPEICDKLDNDCDDLIDENGVCAVTELFALHGNVDLLVVVDAGGPAEEVRERFLDVLPAILQPLFREEMTSQIAVVGANGEPGALPWGTADGQPFLRSWTTNLADATAWVGDAIANLPGELPPRALDMAHHAVLAAAGSHESFDRPRTKLAVLFVTPRPDQSEGSPHVVAADLDQWQNRLWTAWAVLPIYEGTCDPVIGESETPIATTPLQQFVVSEVGSANLFDACAPTLDHLRLRLTVGDELIAGTSRTVYPLGHAVQEDTLQVRRVYAGHDELLDGYVASGRALTFSDPLPAEGVLRVEYDLAP